MCMSIIVIEMVIKYGTPNVTKILQQCVFILKIDFQFLKIDEFRFSKIDLIFDPSLFKRLQNHSLWYVRMLGDFVLGNPHLWSQPHPSTHTPCGRIPWCGGGLSQRQDVGTTWRAVTVHMWRECVLIASCNEVLSNTRGMWGAKRTPYIQNTPQSSQVRCKCLWQENDMKWVCAICT